MTPIFANEDVGSQRDRRLLVISYHFPPDRAIGAKRWEKFSHFAAQRGWGIDVVMVAPPPSADFEMVRRALPPGVRAFAIPLPSLALERAENAIWNALRGNRNEPVPDSQVPVAPAQRVARVSSIARSELRWSLNTSRGWMRVYWAALDFARIQSWGDAVVNSAAEIFERGVHRAVITSGPPFMSHDAGRRISRRYHIPFVMDMRDPWSHVERLSEAIATPAWTWMASHHEAKAVGQATLVIANTEVARQQLAVTYESRSADILTVTNGGDEDPLPPQRRGGTFKISHAGTLYLDRDPRALFQAAAQVIRKLSLTSTDLSLEFIGELEAVGGFPIEEVARLEGISDYVHTGSPRPYSEALAFMADATMLVTMSGSNMAAIPAKTFECVRFPAWILALSAPGSATALLLDGTNADVAAPRDIEGIARIIETRYLEHKGGALPEPVARDVRFSRGHQAGILFDAIESKLK